MCNIARLIHLESVVAPLPMCFNRYGLRHMLLPSQKKKKKAE